MFHLVLTAVLLPGLAWAPLFPLTVLAVSVAGCVFIVAEAFRCFPMVEEERYLPPPTLERDGETGPELRTNFQETGLHEPAAGLPPDFDPFLPYTAPFLEGKDKIKPWIAAPTWLLVGSALPLMLYAMWVDAAFPLQSGPPGTQMPSPPPRPLSPFKAPQGNHLPHEPTTRLAPSLSVRPYEHI